MQEEPSFISCESLFHCNGTPLVCGVRMGRWWDKGTNDAQRRYACSPGRDHCEASSKREPATRYHDRASCAAKHHDACGECLLGLAAAAGRQSAMPGRDAG